MIYYFLELTLILSVLIGFRLIKAGKEIENKNLSSAGTLWLVINGIKILLTIIMLFKSGLFQSQPSLCGCVTEMMEIGKKFEAAGDDADKIAELVKEFKAKEKECKAIADKLEEGKSEEEIKKMKEDFEKDCEALKGMK